MAQVNSLHTHLVDELADLLDAEQQITEALPKMAQAATSKPLRAAFEKHLKETRQHITRLNQAMRSLGEEPRSKTCEAMQGLLDEGETEMNNAPEGALRDAVMITGAQKVEHYEMASYGTARTYAQVLGEREVARLLGQTLKEEKATDSKLTQIAESSVNEQAAEEWQSQEEESRLAKTAEWAGSAAGLAASQLSQGIRRVASAVGVASDRSSPRRSSSGSLRPSSGQKRTRTSSGPRRRGGKKR